MTVQSKSCKDNELNISVSILKLSNKNIDSFTYFGTNTAASVDPSKQNKSINDEVNFRNEQQQCVRSFTMIKNNQKTNLNYSFQQYATTISTPVSMLKDESTYTYNVSLKTTLSTRCTNSKIYKSPLRSIITSDTIPATILILMIHTAAIPLIKMPSLLLIVLESESANLWKHKSALNMTLNDNITAGIDHQSLKKSTFIKYIQCCWFRLEAIPEEDQSRISNDLTNLLYPNKDVEHTIVTSPTDQNLENKFVSDIHDQIHENDDNVQVINLDQHETTLLQHSISLQSKASVSKTHTLAFLCQRNTLQADKDLPTLHDVSVSNSIHFETKIQEKELNETANEFPVVTTSRKPINNINEYKELPLIFPKHAGRRKRLRKKQHNELPPWIFPKENSTTYNHRFKRPHCKPCECICTPLPTCSNVPSRSFLDDIHPCDTYSIQ
ncbi:unnamed protein product [Rotaria magnacalcarata]|uniref:Uncharacterized protein n=1 Tax=Rotaria magnacalcarata TaxID=392030 RepID=A0A815VG80_9BILA|nr:unnamed protein product [Rotaria magnacalcarata]